MSLRQRINRIEKIIASIPRPPCPVCGSTDGRTGLSAAIIFVPQNEPVDCKWDPYTAPGHRCPNCGAKPRHAVRIVEIGVGQTDAAPANPDG